MWVPVAFRVKKCRSHLKFSEIRPERPENCTNHIFDVIDVFYTKFYPIPDFFRQMSTCVACRPKYIVKFHFFPFWAQTQKYHSFWPTNHQSWSQTRKNTMLDKIWCRIRLWHRNAICAGFFLSGKDFGKFQCYLHVST